jgi:hypothetical protein
MADRRQQQRPKQSSPGGVRRFLILTLVE